MKTSRIEAAMMVAAALLLALPSAAAFAEQQQPTESGDRGRPENIVVTSSQSGDNESGQEQYTEQGEEGNNAGQSMADEHRSKVSTFVQNLLKTADKRQDGIGEQVRQVAKEQDDSEASTTEAIKQVEERGSFKTFLIGTDYKNIGVIRSQIAKTKARIEQLSRLFDQMPSSTISASTTEQLQSLKQTEDKLTGFVTQNENKFSLFGWFMRLFSK